ncbi:MAG: hypothetical protein AAF587_40170 [Bacteroidota bacterium]
MKNWLQLSVSLLLILLVSISPTPAQDSTQGSSDEDDYEVDGPMAYGMRCAIFFGPTDMELEDLALNIAAADIDRLEAGEDDGDQALQGKEWLNTRKIKVYETDASNLYFRKMDGKLVKLPRRKLQGTWGVVFFDPKKDPIQVGASDIAEEGAIYFGLEQ